MVIRKRNPRFDPCPDGKEPPMPITLAVLISLIFTIYGLAYPRLLEKSARAS